MPDFQNNWSNTDQDNFQTAPEFQTGRNSGELNRSKPTRAMEAVRFTALPVTAYSGHNLVWLVTSVQTTGNYQ